MSSALYLDQPTVPRPPDRVLVDDTRAQQPRWRPGERLEQLFERRCAAGMPDAVCVDHDGQAHTYRRLNWLANRLARHLLARWIGPGHRVALLFDDPVQAYVGMLAVLKAGAAFVPLDPGFPADRIAYIVADAEASAVLTLSHLRPHLVQAQALVVAVDDMAARITALPGDQIRPAERGQPVDDLAYIIYTSGSTGRPKGVAVQHPSIVNFVRVAAEVYGIRPNDRMYQGLTIAFDFSFEEIWVPWAVGATLVPKPNGASLLGVDLHAFLAEQRVTALCCVPTLLATLEEDLPLLRFLLVSGEACPQDLITRWHRPDRRFLNVYGPTEATVTATWTVLHPDRPVTIGQPLPTYATVVLDPQHPTRALPHGAVGEIGIAGIGLAAGYLNRDALTAKAFVPDFLDLPGNPSGRIYRTGDLGRVNPEGEIEYLGRIDMQVKIRGYRIELTEIESVLLQVPGVAAAAVDTVEPAPGAVELAGYYSVRSGMAAVDRDEIRDEITAQLRARLPPYMVPAFLEQLPEIPMTTQGKVDRRALPAPSGPRSGATGRKHVAAASDIERTLAGALARTLGLDAVSVDSDFFDDLGANSLLLARFSALVRAETELPPPSMRDIYRNPTVRRLARLLGDAAPAAGPAKPTGTVVRASTAGYWLVGTLQLLYFLGMVGLGALLLETAILWAIGGSTSLAVAGRSAVFGLALLVAWSGLPIAAKWLLIGRWTPREIRLWSLDHFRFWLVKTLIRTSPPALLVGSPLYNWYLRALGARIGAGATILARTLPVATDLLTVGAGAVIRRDVLVSGYRAVAGTIQIGRVGIGRAAFVGDKTVLDIDTEIGDGAQLGHSSSLHPGQRIPAGERWHGSPAEPTTVDYRLLEPATAGVRLRRGLYSAWQLLGLIVIGPLLGTLLVVLATSQPASPVVGGLLADRGTLLSSPAFYGWVALSTAWLFLLGVLSGLAAIIILPRLLQPLVRPGRTYRLYGLRWIIAQAITGMTNSRFYLYLFGDSSMIVHYLQSIGYRMPRLQQTGSNFGVEVRQDAPLLCTFGSGTMVSDGLTVLNADITASTFRVSHVPVGGRNFFGNNIAYPAGARVGENVLLATKVMVPLDGPVRENIGLLGSPCFEIPRTVSRDTEFDHLKEPAVLRRRLWRKNRHNTVSALLLLVLRWLQAFLGVLLVLAAANSYQHVGVLAIAAVGLLGMPMVLGLNILADRLVLGFRSLRPRFVSIYDPYFWLHERHWKLSANNLFAGTPFRNVVWRLLGVRIGRRVFDDGCAITEKTLATVGDDAVLNAGSVIQCHSLEDGTFKSDRTVLGDGVTLGVGAFVHYGVRMGDGSTLDADAFLMKGETVPAFAGWRGNPAEELPG